jgi:hypothetical protein
MLGCSSQYTLKKAQDELYFKMRILKKENNNIKSLAYTSLIRPIIEYASC